VPDFTDRPCESEDFWLMRLLTARSWTAHGPRVALHVGDLCWRFFRHSTDRFHLWFTSDERLAAWAEFPPDEGCCDFAIDPDYDDVSLADAIIDWAEHERQREEVDAGEAHILNLNAFPQDTARTELLVRRGYTRQSSAILHFLRDLNEEVAPRSVEDYDIRPLRNLDEFNQTLHGGDIYGRYEVYGRRSLLPAFYERMLRFGMLSHGQDIVALDADGIIRAACMWWLDANNHVALIEPVGCHDAHLRRGLGSAVMTEAFRQMQLRRARQVIVRTDSRNTAAIACYQSLGFRLCGTEYDWHKIL
jgi:GNAT superfamily N-acetyltransferase